MSQKLYDKKNQQMTTHRRVRLLLSLLLLSLLSLFEQKCDIYYCEEDQQKIRGKNARLKKIHDISIPIVEQQFVPVVVHFVLLHKLRQQLT